MSEVEKIENENINTDLDNENIIQIEDINTDLDNENINTDLDNENIIQIENNKRLEARKKLAKSEKQIEDIKNLLSFEVSHNRLIFLDKPIKNKEKLHKNGKYIYGKDYRSNLEVEILDKDYGKSAELIRLVLETRKKSKLLIIAGVLLSIVMFGIMASIVNNYINPKTETKNINPINTIITQAPQPINQIEIKTQTGGQNIDNLQNNNIIDSENKNKIVTDETNKQLAQLDYQAQELVLQLNLLNKKNELLQSELNDQNLLITQKENLIIKQSLEIAEKNQKLQNLTSNEFILFLGNKVVQECEKKQNEYCKDLYFKYLQK